MELRITTDLTTAIPAEIAFNFEELERELTERLAYYSNLLITEDTVKEGRADRAKLNALKTAIDKRRKEIKKLYNAPLAVFEEKAKRLMALIDAPIGAIDSQLDAFEEQRREKKRAEITDAYDAIVPVGLREIIPLERIYSPKWENATMKMPAVEAEIADRVKRTTADMMVLDTIEPEYALAVREAYMQTYDIEAAVAKREALKRAAEAYRAVEQPKSKPAEQKPAEPTVEPQKAQEAPKAPEADERLFLLRLEMNVTKDQAAALKAFLVQNNINFRKI